MTAPRLEVDLDKIRHNACTLVERLAHRGISVTGVTKAALGAPQIAAALLDAGVSALGDSRIENIEAMRRAEVPASITLIRSPMRSQVDRVVAQADDFLETEAGDIAVDDRGQVISKAERRWIRVLVPYIDFANHRSGQPTCGVGARR